MGENNNILNPFLNLIVSNQIEIAEIIKTEYIIAKNNLEEIFISYTMSDVYYFIVIVLNYGQHINSSFNNLMSNLSLFAYVKIGYKYNKIAIAIATLMIYFEMESDDKTFSIFLTKFICKFDQCLVECYCDVVEIRDFFVKHISSISEDPVLLEKVTQLKANLPFVPTVN